MILEEALFGMYMKGGNYKLRKFALVLTLASLFVFVLAGSAFATHMGSNDTPGVNTDRGLAITSDNCGDCHENDNTRIGPHGGYTTTTDKCMTCHDIHGQAENIVLLKGTTVTGACNYCHDLTTSNAGPYYENGLTATGGAHRVVGIKVYEYVDTEGTLETPNTEIFEGMEVTAIPGGVDADGSEGQINNKTASGLTPDFTGSVFTCDSCHTPHGYNCVDEYLGESNVKYSTQGLGTGVTAKFFLTNRLLKQKANHVDSGSFPAVTEYGSRWCAQCHMGQDQYDQTNNVAFTPTYHNHPVDESLGGYMYLQLAWERNKYNATTLDGGAATYASMNDFMTRIKADRLITVGSNGNAELQIDPRSNAQFAMNDKEVYFDANGDQVTTNRSTTDPMGNMWVSYVTYRANGPACQQCHGSAREMDTAWSLSNPARRSFPHISANKGLLVESNDDFCLNCHGIDDLP